MSQTDSATLGTLAQRLSELEQSRVTRQEFDELKAQLNKVLERLELLAPANDVPDEHLAIMSAVFAAMIGKRFKIRSVKSVTEPSGWTQAGRVNLHALRHVRRS